MSKLVLSPKLSLPIDAVTQTIGILAKRRAGKSYTARRFAEQLAKAKQQVVIVDPKGDWWGIRSAADGHSPGLPITILGGERGDVPLEVGAGEVIAKLVAEERVSVLLDLSLFRKHEVSTFMGSFLENLYRIKAREEFRTALMLIIDEADAVAPQKPYKGEERMLGATEDIVRRGGQRGIGCLMITQRSAVLNKNVLTQIQVLIVLRTIAPQDLAALNAWIDVHGTEKQRATLMESLPSLPTGDAWVWSPGWPDTDGIFQRVSVCAIETFDSGATPKPGEKRKEPKNVADVDLEALRKTMAATIERAKENDPKELKREIQKLRTELSKKQPVEKIHSESKRAELPVLKDRQIARLEKIVNRVANILGEHSAKHTILQTLFMGAIEPVHQGLRALKFANTERRSVSTSPAVAKRIEASEGPERTCHKPLMRNTSARGAIPIGSTAGDTFKLGSGERRCAIAIAQHQPNGCAREQLTTLTGFKRSTRNTYLQRLLSAGLVAQSGERFVITQEGLDWIGDDYEPLPTGAALQDYWLNKLPQGESAVLRVVLENTDGIDREMIGAKTNFKRSTRNTYIQRLAARELVTISGEIIQPCDSLFD